MLYYINNLPINKIVPYHRKEKLPDIRSTNEYKFLRNNIEENGIKDPILIRNIKGVLQVHVGEQRLLIAEQMGLKNLKSFVYNDYKGKVTETIKDIGDVIKHFIDVTVPTCDCILRYIKHGQIKL
jgi:ParB-like chromosome segregation protein Spo0J